MTYLTALTQVTKGSVTQYALNGLGQRVAKTGSGVEGGTVYFVYDETGHLVGEYDGAGAVIQETIWLGDLPVGVLKAEALYNVNPDHLGAPLTVTDATGQIVWRWDRDPYGNGKPNENPGGLGTFTYNLRFPGQYYDKETEFYYNYYRDYNPKAGRYVQSDPIGSKGGINPFVYVQNNPVSGIDPLELWTVNIGISGSINIPLIGVVGVGGGGFGGIVYDGTHWAWYGGGGGGAGGGAGGSLGIQIGGSDAKSVCDLRGPFGSVSASGGEGLIIGGEGYTGSGSNGQTVSGGNFFIGGGVGTPVSGNGGVTYTWVKPW